MAIRQLNYSINYRLIGSRLTSLVTLWLKLSSGLHMSFNITHTLVYIVAKSYPLFYPAFLFNSN